MLAIALVLHAIITFCNGTGARVEKKNRISLSTDNLSLFVAHPSCLVSRSARSIFFVCTLLLLLGNQESRGVYLDLPVVDLPIIFVLYDSCPHLLSSFQLYECSSVFHGHPPPPPANDERNVSWSS